MRKSLRSSQQHGISSIFLTDVCAPSIAKGENKRGLNRSKSGFELLVRQHAHRKKKKKVDVQSARPDEKQASSHVKNSRLLLRDLRYFPFWIVRRPRASTIRTHYTANGPNRHGAVEPPEARLTSTTHGLELFSFLFFSVP